jgi:hypothetical protein
MHHEGRRPWLRFSIRTLILTISLICAVLGFCAAYIDDYRQQSRSLAVVDRLQGRAETIPANGPHLERWLVTRILGSDAYVRVILVELNDKEVDDEVLDSLGGLIHLRSLALDRTDVTDAGLPTLSQLPSLTSLSLRFTSVSDEGLKVVGDLPNLAWLYLTGSRITDASIDQLVRLKNLKELYIRWTYVTNAGGERLRRELPHALVFHHRLLD